MPGFCLKFFAIQTCITIHKRSLGPRFASHDHWIARTTTVCGGLGSLQLFHSIAAGAAPNAMTHTNAMTTAKLRTAVSKWFSNRNEAIATYGHISTWDTSGVKDMSYLFCSRECSFKHDGAETFNNDISAWDTGSVTKMHKMFFGARSFNVPIGGWDVRKVEQTAAAKGWFSIGWFSPAEPEVEPESAPFPPEAEDFAAAEESPPLADWERRMNASEAAAEQGTGFQMTSALEGELEPEW